MMALSKQRKFTFNILLEDIRGSQCCVIKVRQYIFRLIYHKRILNVLREVVRSYAL